MKRPNTLKCTCMHSWLNSRLSMSQCMYDSYNKCMCLWARERAKDWMNEWMNEWKMNCANCQFFSRIMPYLVKMWGMRHDGAVLFILNESNVDWSGPKLRACFVDYLLFNVPILLSKCNFRESPLESNRNRFSLQFFLDSTMEGRSSIRTHTHTCRNGQSSFGWL